MKKIILLAACLAVVPAGAEELKFVTALSQPVASFAHLESVNNKRPAEALFVNFCNTGVSAGTISAKGLVRMNELRLTGNSQVGSSSVMNYQIMEPTGFAIREGGSVLGAKLLAEKADPRDIVVEAGVDLNDNASFMAADLASLQIGSGTNTTKVVPSAQSNEYVMEWKDDYDHDYKVLSSGVIETGSTYDTYLLRYRLEEEGVCGAGTPAASESTRTRNCADDSSYGDDYEGVINEKYSYLPDCEWKEVSNTCKRKPRYNCISHFAWKTASNPNSSFNEDCSNAVGMSNKRWKLGSYSAKMVCGGETEHHGGVLYCKPGESCDCEPGQVYLWRDTYHCVTVPGAVGKQACGYGYYCATCKQVKSLSECVSAPKSMAGQSCSMGGSIGIDGFVGTGGTGGSSGTGGSGGTVGRVDITDKDMSIL